MKRALFLLPLAFFLAEASEPGQPMVCEDVQIQQRGFTVRTYGGPLHDFHPVNTCTEGPRIDLAGYFLSGLAESIACQPPYFDTYRYTFKRVKENQTPIPFFTLEGRCVDSDHADRGEVDCMNFDWQTGRLYFRLIARSVSASGTPLYEDSFSMCVIEGFPKLSDFYPRKRGNNDHDSDSNSRGRQHLDRRQ